MKVCPSCNQQLDDSALFCDVCGTQFQTQNNEPTEQYNAPQYNQQQYNQQYNAPQYNYTPAYDPYDHTAEFEAADISANKVIAMLVYLSGWIGILVALLAGGTSPYASFHVRQALKFEVINVLGALCALVLCWTFIVPIAYGILAVALVIVKIICFFQICKGKAIEPVIIRSFGFLR